MVGQFYTIIKSRVYVELDTGFGHTLDDFRQTIDAALGACEMCRSRLLTGRVPDEPLNFHRTNARPIHTRHHRDELPWTDTFCSHRAALDLAIVLTQPMH